MYDDSEVETVSFEDIMQVYRIQRQTWYNWTCKFPSEIIRVRQGRYTKESAMNFLKRRGVPRLDQDLRRLPVRPHFDFGSKDDMFCLYALELQFYGDKAVHPSQAIDLLKTNPYLNFLAFNPVNRTDIWGALTVYPINDEERLQQLAMYGRTAVGLGGLVGYDIPGVYNLYIGSVAMKPGYQTHLRELVRRYMDWWAGNYPRLRVGRVYARAISEEGERTAMLYGFSRHYQNFSLVPKAMILDLSIPTPHPVIGRFQEKLKNSREIQKT